MGKKSPQIKVTSQKWNAYSHYESRLSIIHERIDDNRPYSVSYDCSSLRRSE